MNWYMFLLRKIFRNPMSALPLLISFLLIGNTYYQYYTVMKRDSAGIRAAAFTPSYGASVLESDLRLLDQDDPYVTEFQKQIEIEREREADNEDWSSYYLHQIMSVRQMIQAEITAFGEESENLYYMNRQLAYWDYMYRNKAPYEPLASYTNGIAFICLIYDSFLFTCVLAVIAYLLSDLFGSLYSGHMMRTVLLPADAGHRILWEALMAFTTGILALMLLSILSFGTGTVFDGTGTLMKGVQVFNQPVMYASLKSLVLKIGALTAAGILFCTGMLKTICIFAEDRMSALGISLIVLLGASRLPDGFTVAADMAHWLPMTYLRPMAVVTGQLSYTLKNDAVTFGRGFAVLIVSGILLWLFSMVYEIKRCGGAK